MRSGGLLLVLPHILARNGHQGLQAREVKGSLSHRSQVRIDALGCDPRPAFHDTRLDGGVGGAAKNSVTPAPDSHSATSSTMNPACSSGADEGTTEPKLSRIS